MRPLTEEEIIFYEDLLKYSCRLHNGSYCFQPRNLRYGSKRYKRSRINMQLHTGMKLTIFEFVHHIDENKTNDSIENLEIVTPEKHASHHHAGKTIIGKFKPYNKFNKNKINFILNNTIKYFDDNNKLNYKQIGIMSKCSGFIAKIKIIDNINYFNDNIKKIIINKSV